MPILVGVAVLLLLLWAAKKSRQGGFLNASRQRMGGTLALIIAAVLLARGDLAVGLGLGLFGIYLLAEALPWPLSLLAAYLDGRNTSWREHAQRDAGTAEGAPAPHQKSKQGGRYGAGNQPAASRGGGSRRQRAAVKKVCARDRV